MSSGKKTDEKEPKNEGQMAPQERHDLYQKIQNLEWSLAQKKRENKHLKEEVEECKTENAHLADELNKARGGNSDSESEGNNVGWDILFSNGLLRLNSIPHMN